MRTVIDTNVWISALLNPAGPPARILAALMAARFILVTSEQLLDELRQVLLRPRFARRYGVTPAKIAALLLVLRSRGEVVEVSAALPLYRDPSDDVVIATAINGRADALVSRDDDLKGVPELAEILVARGIAVLTVRHFLVLIEPGA